MNAVRPSLAIALILTSIGTTGCPIYNCSNLDFENREMVGEFALGSDGLAQPYYGDAIDPMTAEGCEALCVDIDWASIDTIHSCEAEVLVEPISDTTEIADTADTGTSGDGVVQITCVASGQDECVGGRHAGSLAQRAQGHGVDGVAAWLAREACGEAGSVHAFRQLARQLRHHGAPAALIDAARAAAGDEVRHTRMVRRLAQQRGGVPAPVEVRPMLSEDLLTLAMENAVEGCVHETFAAARAGWQAQHAEDDAVRAVSAVLAEDEARHADLAAAVHAWVCTVLPAQQATAVEAARKAAWARLAEAHPAADTATITTLGLPDAATHRVLVQALSGALAA